MITTDEIDAIYTDAVEALRNYADRAAKAIETKEALQASGAEAVRSGVIDGLRNDRERDAKLREACAIQYALLAGAEADEIRARGESQARDLEVKRVEMLMRLAELKAKA